MDKNAIAKELAELGQAEAKLMRKLMKVQKRRCEMLSAIACSDDAGLEPDVAAAASAPKDGGGEN